MSHQMQQDAEVPLKTAEPPELDIQVVVCEVCFEVIGKIDMSTFKPPIHGSMFLAKDKKHGYPKPFHESLAWEDLRCPMCRTRPFHSRNYIMNDMGEYIGFLFECEIYDKGFISKLALGGHKNSHSL
jgi:hypothetical protein